MTPASSRVARRTGWRAFLMTVLGRAYPRLIGQQREPSWILFETLMPTVALCSYVFVYRGLRAPEEFVGFAVLGGAMIAFWVQVMWGMASQLYWEKETGNLGLYIMAPCSMMAILLGMALGGLLATSVRAAMVLAVGALCFHVHFAVSSWAGLAAVFALTMVALYGLGMMLASVFLLLGREAWHYVHLTMEPVYLVSGFYFPLRSFPSWVGFAASALPLSLGLDAMRQLAFARSARLGFLGVRVEMAVLAALGAVFLVAAAGMLRRLERLAVREGRLTESRA